MTLVEYLYVDELVYARGPGAASERPYVTSRRRVVHCPNAGRILRVAPPGGVPRVVVRFHF